MSKASLLELCHGEKKYKEILFPVLDGGDFSISMYRYLQKCLYKGLCPKLSTNGYIASVYQNLNSHRVLTYYELL